MTLPGKLVATLGVLIVLALPRFFVGASLIAPAGNLLIFFAAVIVALVWFDPGYLAKRYIRTILCAGLIIAIIAMGIGSFVARNAGWDICLDRITSKETLKTACEKSLLFPDGRKTTQRLSLDFNNSIAYFINNPELNFYRNDEPKRKDVEYSFKALGTFNLDEDGGFRIKSSKPINVSISDKDNNTVFSETGISEKEINIVKGNFKVELSGQFKMRDNASVKVDGAAFPASSPSQARALRALICLVWSGIILGLLSSLLYGFSIFTKDKLLAYQLGILLVFPLLVARMLPSALYNTPSFYLYLFLTAFYFWFLIFLLKPYKNRENYGWIGCLIIFWVFLLTNRITSYGQPVMLAGGSDPLVHESFSRVILFGSLHDKLAGGENGVFYFQPLYRYFLALIHYLFGEQIWNIYFIQINLFIFSSLFLVLKLKKLIFRSIISFAILSTPFFVTGLFTASDILTHGLAIPALVFSLALAIEALISEEILHFYLSLLLLGIAISTRPELTAIIPSYLYLGYLLLRKYPLWDWFKNAVKAIVSFAAFPLLIVIRNSVVAHKFAFMPKSGATNIASNFCGAGVCTSGPSDSSAFSAIEKILSFYSTRPSELASIIFNRIYSEIILRGDLTLRYWSLFSWIVFIAAILIYLASRKKQEKHFVLLDFLLFAFLLVIGTQMFFDIHNGFAMIVIFDLFIALFGAVAIWMFGPAHERTKDFFKRLFLKSRVS